MPSILPTHFPSSPNPHPSHPHSTHLPFPAHSPSAPIPLTFCPQPALFPSPAHSPLSVTHRTCSSVTLSSTTSNIFPSPPLSPVFLPCQHHLLPPYSALTCKLFLSSYFFVGTCLKHCNANSSLFVTHFYRQKHNYQ